MANKKPTPLRDEKAAPIEELQMQVSALAAAVNTLAENKTQTEMKLSEQFQRTVSTAVVSAVKNMLDERQRQIKGEEARNAKGETTPDYQTLAKRYDEVLTKYNNLLDFHKKHWPELVNQCNNTVSSIGEQSRQNSESLTKIAAFIDKANEGLLSDCVPPPFPKRIAEIRPFLKRYPLYVAKRLRLLQRIRKFMHFCAFAAWIFVLCFLCFIAYENARLRTVEEKYILLRDFSRLDKSTSERADFIEWLYSDEDEHRQKIDTLWQMRRERLQGKRRK